jgi:hypothetical protein
MVAKRNIYRILVGKPEGKRPLGRYRRRWEDNIKMDLTNIGLEVWTGFIWRKTGTSGGPCEYGNKPSGSIKCWEIIE